MQKEAERQRVVESQGGREAGRQNGIEAGMQKEAERQRGVGSQGGRWGPYFRGECCFLLMRSFFIYIVLEISSVGLSWKSGQENESNISPLQPAYIKVYIKIAKYLPELDIRLRFFVTSILYCGSLHVSRTYLGYAQNYTNFREACRDPDNFNRLASSLVRAPYS
jgi:hypothetical protein